MTSSWSCRRSASRIRRQTYGRRHCQAVASTSEESRYVGPSGPASSDRGIASRALVDFGSGVVHALRSTSRVER